MKKTVLLMMALMGALTVQAEDYSYLTFETADGTKVSVPASLLKLSISGTTLTAGDQTFTLSDLSKMYFSASDESSTSGIESIDYSQLTDDNAKEIYDLRGQKVSKEQMRKGVYVVRTNGKTYKVAVK